MEKIERRFLVVDQSWRSAIGVAVRVRTYEIATIGTQRLELRTGEFGARLLLRDSQSSPCSTDCLAELSSNGAWRLTEGLPEACQSTVTRFEVLDGGRKWEVEISDDPRDVATASTVVADAAEQIAHPSWLGAELGETEAPEPLLWFGRLGRQLNSRIDGIERYAKLFAIILGILGFVTVCFPQLRRRYERIVMPTESYQVGVLWANRDQGRFSFTPGDYSSPAWDSGLDGDALLKLARHTIRVTGVVVGRTSASTGASIMNVLTANQCLYVRDVSFHRYQDFQPNPETMVGSSELRGAGFNSKLRNLIGVIPDPDVKKKEDQLPLCQQTDRGDPGNYPRRTARLEAKLAQLADNLGRVRAEIWHDEREKSEHARRVDQAQRAYDAAAAAVQANAVTRYPVCPRATVWVTAQKVTC